MEMQIVGTLHLSDEEITITIWGKLKDGKPSPTDAYNEAKETIIIAEEERRDKIIDKQLLKEDKS